MHILTKGAMACTPFSTRLGRTRAWEQRQLSDNGSSSSSDSSDNGDKDNGGIVGSSQ